jgi:arsenate reductase (thioredoxin)
MAEGFARALKSDRLEAWSAGITPKGLDPRAVRVMAEAGLDISGQRSKSLAELPDVHFDYAITLCDHAHQVCPIFPGAAKTIHVPFDDPPRLAAETKSEDEALAHYRRVRDEIRAFVLGLPDNLTEKETKLVLDL